jgi:hypothetical protein
MGTYILSNANRFYVALETAFGTAAPITAQNRYPAVSLVAQQTWEQAKRKDKTGSRTFLGNLPNARRSTAFETLTYMTSWSGTGTPSYGPLFQSALGGTPVMSGVLTVRLVSNNLTFQTTAPHGLRHGAAVSWNNEIRFVATAPDPSTIVLNAAFTATLIPGTNLSPAVTYGLATRLPSVTLYDFWDPASAVQRMLAGATVDRLGITVNGDLHEFAFRGPAADLADTSSFASGTAGLSQFPTEPAVAAFDYSIVPGYLGQAWIGSATDQLFTLTGAQVQLRNNIDARHREFGATIPRAMSAGKREVETSFSVLAQDDAQTIALHQAARLRSTIPVMLQLGQTQGQLMGIYMPSVVPEIPNFNDSDDRLHWDFQACQAQGAIDDELWIAFA